MAGCGKPMPVITEDNMFYCECGITYLCDDCSPNLNNTTEKVE